MKNRLERVYNTASVSKDIHYAGVGIQDTATLCGMLDFEEDRGSALVDGAMLDGIETDKPVTCYLCLSMVKAIQSCRKERIK